MQYKQLAQTEDPGSCPTAHIMESEGDYCSEKSTVQRVKVVAQKTSVKSAARPVMSKNSVRKGDMGKASRILHAPSSADRRG